MNVAMPHLRGKWSPTKAILRTLEVFHEAFHLAPCALALSINRTRFEVALKHGKCSGSLRFCSSR